MQCPACGSEHAGHERTPGAVSIVCEKCTPWDRQDATRLPKPPNDVVKTRRKNLRKAGNAQ